MPRKSRLANLLLAVALHQAVALAGDFLPSNDVVLHPGEGSHGAVASESIECSTIGRDLMARGGNAADALVGTTFCVGVIGMYHSGIGGGGFAMVRDADGNYEAVDFRETAPAAAFEDMYKHNVNGSIYGGLSVAVPSELRGLEYIHTKYGVLPWKTVMQGAIHIARNGFKVSTDLVNYMERTVGGKENNFLVDDPTWAQDFAPNGTLLEAGDIITRKRLANTLEEIAEYGPEVFYTGEMAEAMVDLIQNTGGIMTLDDFKNYGVISRLVKNVTYHGVELYGIGAPAAGSICFQMLKTMEQYNSSDWTDRNLTWHRFTEAMRFAYAARGELGDPDFVEGVDVYEKHILSRRNLKTIKDRILDEHTQPPSDYTSNHIMPPPSHGTSHIVTADKSGMALSLTTTVNLLFGAQIMEAKSGIILNNEMNDFSIPGVPNEFGFYPSEANFIRPNKRPLSSITPVIAAYPNGTFVASVGAAGGSRIISATALALWHAIEHGMTMDEALAMPRMHDQLFPDMLMMERGFNNATATDMRERGHNVTWVRDGLSSVQGILLRDDGVFDAASEPRQKNSAGLTL